MAADPAVFVIGEDVGESLRGITKGLLADFGPERVLDAPLSEQAFTSFATGAALRGRRPVVEYQIPALLYLVFEQIMNQAHKFRLVSGGQASVPVTYLVPGSGTRVGLAGQQSDNPYAFFATLALRRPFPRPPTTHTGCLPQRSATTTQWSSSPPLPRSAPALRCQTKLT